MTMKRNILLLMILTVISLGASGQKYTIYVDDFDSEIKIPNRAINLIRLAFIDGIRNTNRINVVDAVSAGSDLSLSPLEDARRFRAEYLLKETWYKEKQPMTEAPTDVTTAVRTVIKRNSPCVLI